MTQRIDVDCFCTVTPSWFTAAGRRGVASETRFCTCTCAMSRFVPTSKVTSIVAEPSLELLDE